MGQLLLLLVVALTVAAVVFGVTVLISGNDPGLTPVEPDGRAVPLPGNRPLDEQDVARVRFDTALRGYRMAQVDQALRRAAYDIGYKDELIGVLQAEVAALREGRTADADALRTAREAALEQVGTAPGPQPAAGTAGDTGRPDAADHTVDAADRAAAGPPEAADGAQADRDDVDRAPADRAGVTDRAGGPHRAGAADRADDPDRAVPGREGLAGAAHAAGGDLPADPVPPGRKAAPPPDRGPDQPLPDRGPDQPLADRGPDQPPLDRGPDQPLANRAPDQPPPDRDPGQSPAAVPATNGTRAADRAADGVGAELR